jgi:hypothetical protein
MILIPPCFLFKWFIIFVFSWFIEAYLAHNLHTLYEVVFSFEFLHVYISFHAMRTLIKDEIAKVDIDAFKTVTITIFFTLFSQ